MLTLFLTLLLAYLAFVVLLFLFQRTLIYHPDKAVGPPQHYGLSGFSEHFVPSEDAVSIQLWYRPASKGFPTIIYYHGNASHIGNRAGILAALAEKGFGVLAVSYRGYGKSTGTPTEQGIYQDARAAIAFLTQTQHIPLNRIILYGESLGTGVAVQMASEVPVGGLVLEAAYTSVAARAAELYYYIPVRFLIQDKFNSLEKIGKVKAPVLCFHGERDTVIPIAHGKTLFNAVISPKQSFFFPHVAHNDFDSAVISAHVLDFAKAYKLIEP
jgi:fermentation-respiration switch protein FrsA (DUF1100 family)